MTGDIRNPVYTLKGLSQDYDGYRVLDVPELSLEEGRIYALVGPNGSGKTTFLSILNLIQKPTRGEILFRGEPAGVDEATRRKQRLSMSFLLQEPYLFNASVRKNVSWGLKARGAPKAEIEARVSWALELVGLSGFTGRKARKLSGGESQRVALARALATRPRVLLLDEPMANIDHQGALLLESIITKMNRDEGITVLMTTHDLDQAYRLADSVFTLFGGSLISSPMDNLFRGSLLKRENYLIFKTRKMEMVVGAGVEDPGITHALVNPEDIIVSQQPFSSSARNVLKGNIINIGQRGSTVRLTVLSGEKFTVTVTRESYLGLSLELGKEVFLTFKASSVQLL